MGAGPAGGAGTCVPNGIVGGAVDLPHVRPAIEHTDATRILAIASLIFFVIKIGTKQSNQAVLAAGTAVSLRAW